MIDRELDSTARLAELVCDCAGPFPDVGMSHEPQCSSGLVRMALRHNDRLAEALRLGLAWQACEKALPERAAGLSVGHAQWRGTGGDGEFYSHIITPGVGGGPETGAYGPTPADALSNLREALDNR
jgi:hypothetical protein